MRRATLILTTALLCLVPAAAQAADPGRWKQVGTTQTKAEYYQGIASDDRGGLLFDGFQVGVYRTDLRLREKVRVENLLPGEPEGFNHIGDLSVLHDRVVLPLECYHPGQGPDGSGNTCGYGAFGLADRRTLAWQGRVRLDPADIAKAMWAEASPDGALVWTSSGPDLLAYRATDVRPVADATPIRPVRRLPAAVPPSGITGATFVGSRLYLAGQGTGPFQVWSVDLRTGKRRLEIERRWTGESEGLAYVRAFGGTLQWLIQYIDPLGRRPTFGTGHGTIVTFTRRR